MICHEKIEISEIRGFNICPHIGNIESAEVCNRFVTIFINWDISCFFVSCSGKVPLLKYDFKITSRALHIDVPPIFQI